MFTEDNVNEDTLFLRKYKVNELREILRYRGALPAEINTQETRRAFWQRCFKRRSTYLCREVLLVLTLKFLDIRFVLDEARTHENEHITELMVDAFARNTRDRQRYWIGVFCEIAKIPCHHKLIRRMMHKLVDPGIIPVPVMACRYAVEANIRANVAAFFESNHFNVNEQDGRWTNFALSRKFFQSWMGMAFNSGTPKLDMTLRHLEQVRWILQHDEPLILQHALADDAVRQHPELSTCLNNMILIKTFRCLTYCLREASVRDKIFNVKRFVHRVVCKKRHQHLSVVIDEMDSIGKGEEIVDHVARSAIKHIDVVAFAMATHHPKFKMTDQFWKNLLQSRKIKSEYIPFQKILLDKAMHLLDTQIIT